MERRALVAKLLLASCERTEVFGSLLDRLAIETHDDPANWLTAMLDIEVHLQVSMSIRKPLHKGSQYLVGDFWPAGSFGSLGHEEEDCRKDQQRRDDKTLKVCHVEN